MKRIAPLMIALAIAATGCGGDSRFPEATGKGTVRAINAIPASPDITFRIEERSMDSVTYKGASSPQRWDDLTYVFNFDTILSVGAASTRIASRELDVVADREYLFVISGSLNAPTITIWDGAERSFGDSDTVFEARFGHLANSLAAVDVFIAAPGVAPVVGAEAASLSFGEIAPAADLPEGDYVIIVTAAGDPSTVFYTSDTISLPARTALVFTLFDGDENDAAPITLRGLSAAGGVLVFPDINFAPTVRFIQSSRDLATVDVYSDENLTNQVLNNHAFGDISGDIDVAAGQNTFRYTPTGNTGTTLLSAQITTFPGQHANLFATGAAGSYSSFAQAPDRRSISTLAKFTLFNGTANHTSIDLYIVDAGTSIADVQPRIGGIGTSIVTPILALDNGSFDVYITTATEKTVLDGPIQIDVALGDVIETVVQDTVDPATAQFVILPTL